jgi:hypothetical protein
VRGSVPRRLSRALRVVEGPKHSRDLLRVARGLVAWARGSRAFRQAYSVWILPRLTPAESFRPARLPPRRKAAPRPGTLKDGPRSRSAEVPAEIPGGSVALRGRSYAQDGRTRARSRARSHHESHALQGAQRTVMDDGAYTRAARAAPRTTWRERDRGERSLLPPFPSRPSTVGWTSEGRASGSPEGTERAGRLPEYSARLGRRHETPGVRAPSLFRRYSVPRPP